MSYDEAGQPTLVGRFDGDEFAFHAEGNVTEQTDARGRKVRMRDAGMGQLVEHQDPMGHRVRLRYDEETYLVGVENQHGEEYGFVLDPWDASSKSETGRNGWRPTSQSSRLRAPRQSK